jgi:hypothetical protein
MDQTLAGVLGFLIMFVLFMLRLPVAHAMMLGGMASIHI